MDFKKEVIEKSEELPVVVDFWAPWCGPCKHLGPIIEELASEQAGKWELVKVNTDEEQEISTQYKIRGIPAVKMFVKGEVINEFTGALPRIQIENWLQEHLPDERKNALADIQKRLDSGEDAGKELSDFVEQNPDMDTAKLLLAKHLVFNHPEKTDLIIKDLSVPIKFIKQIDVLKTLIEFMTCSLETGSDLVDKIHLARQATRSRDFDKAISTLIEVVMIDKSICNEIPRKATIAIFLLLGEQHEMTIKYRRKFDMALY
ncbi:MAG: thioredoxin [Bacteroidetes bacterium]|nr:thioredoxin [Bacteroidota bacterium]MDA1119580.1 thioredoxin [Bacteroidota bacterium]